jgi:hypothetical protein
MQGIIERGNQSLRKSLCTRHHALTNTNNSLQVSQHVIYRHQIFFRLVQQYFSYISRPSVLLVEETGVPRENHGPAVSH